MNWLKLVMIMLMVVLTGCSSVPVAEDLNQNQANQIIALLNSHGIASMAQKETGGEGKYYVEVKRSFYSEAKALMHEKGLPSPEKMSFSDIIEPKGLLPNSREFEALRLDHALALEIEEMLLTHPAVADVKVVVRTNSVKDSSAAGASVVVQSRPGFELSKDELSAIINRTIPGVQKENILITIGQDRSVEQTTDKEGVYNVSGKVTRIPLVPFIFNWKVPEDDYNSMVIVLVACLLVLGIIGGLVGYWYGYYQYNKNFISGSLPDTNLRSLRLDRPGKDLPEI